MSMRPTYCRDCGEAVSSGPFHECDMSWLEDRKNHEWDTSTPVAAPVCEHYWAWVHPGGVTGPVKSARICMLCHQPDPEWLDHLVEVDLGHENCVKCEFAHDERKP